MLQRDLVIFGGGVAGLWLLDDAIRAGYSAILIEASALGTGQTVASQGIIHGGLKYTLQGLLTGSAAAIREMPQIWRDCLSGKRQPDLSETPVRSDSCYLWRTDSVSSRLGMIGAKFGLRVAPQNLDHQDRPEALDGVPGTVARLEEQVISPAGLIKNLASKHQDSIIQVDADRTEFELARNGQVQSIRFVHPNTEETLTVAPTQIIFTAGAGNATLRRQAGLNSQTMQRRPLHMVLARGPLPRLNGHCVDGAKTRVTITSDMDSENRTVWQIGGQLSETGVTQSARELIASAQAELSVVLPKIDFSNVEWATYRVDRAEGRTSNGGRPETYQVDETGNILTAWPTKLVLAPQLATEILDRLQPPSGQPSEAVSDQWPRPQVAKCPWELATWSTLSSSSHREAA
ncbi:FAD-dependent oxidoreductase [Thalassoroseus pseudoceratinae]|uniref:FAD-dependent oxidoreductase n=1 Tax=Thalassoroseus pseudoceratinae TaxID=2713176 RepID=UPI00141DD797|nr:FAD-dependent oxidoreductase [Thalassoroseus pseudoceratinae]